MDKVIPIKILKYWVDECDKIMTKVLRIANFLKEEVNPQAR